MVLTEQHRKVIEDLMDKKAEIILQPRKEGYIIYEMKKKIVYRPSTSTTE